MSSPVFRGTERLHLGWNCLTGWPQTSDPAQTLLTHLLWEINAALEWNPLGKIPTLYPGLPSEVESGTTCDPVLQHRNWSQFGGRGINLCRSPGQLPEFCHWRDGCCHQSLKFLLSGGHGAAENKVGECTMPPRLISALVINDKVPGQSPAGLNPCSQDFQEKASGRAGRGYLLGPEMRFQR